MVWWRAGRYPAFLGSRLISQIGDLAAVSALTVHLYAVTGSGTEIGLFFLVRVLPRLLGTVAGALGDRLELRRLLIVCDLVSGFLFLAIACVDPGYPLLLFLVFLAESAATVALPAARTMVGRTVPKEHLTTANGLLMSVVSVGFAIGSAVGALTAAIWDYRWALVLDALSFATSALLLTRLPTTHPEPHPEPLWETRSEAPSESGSEVRSKAPSESGSEVRSEMSAESGSAESGSEAPPGSGSEARSDRGAGFGARTGAGFATLRREPGLRAVVIGLVGIAFGTSIDRPALIVLAERNLHAAGTGYGLALGAIAIGGLAASLSVVRSASGSVNARPLAFFAVGILAQAVGHLTMGLAPVVAVLIVGALFAGFGNGLESVCGTTLLQRTARPDSLGALMGLVLSGSYLANALGSLTGGAVVDRIGARWTFTTATTIIILCVPYNALYSHPKSKA